MWWEFHFTSQIKKKKLKFSSQKDIKLDDV